MRFAGRFLVLFGLAMLVYFVGGYLASIPIGTRTIIKLALPVLMLLFTVVCAHIEALRPWRPACLALLAASCGFLAAWLLSDRVLGALGVAPTNMPGISLAKLTESTLIVVTVLLVAHAGGLKREDLYLGRGRLRSWLAIGAVSFGVFASVFLLQWFGRGLTIAALLHAAPWILVFVSANALMEELHFRGLLLRPFEALLGRGGANLCIALFFTLVHAPVQYVPNIAQFLLVLFVLAWAWGFIIQRTDALWGAVLFHAGADLTIVVGIFEAYGAG